MVLEQINKNRKANIDEKLLRLPLATGVYKFLDEQGNILYVGKALNLRNRVRSYFQGDILDRPRIRQMMPFVCDLDIVETNNEIESLVLEAALIKEYKPKYNTLLKDDKSYSYIFVTTKVEFPQLRLYETFQMTSLNKEIYLVHIQMVILRKEFLHTFESFIHSVLHVIS